MSKYLSIKITKTGLKWTWFFSRKYRFPLNSYNWNDINYYRRFSCSHRLWWRMLETWDVDDKFEMLVTDLEFFGANIPNNFTLAWGTIIQNKSLKLRISRVIRNIFFCNFRLESGFRIQIFPTTTLPYIFFVMRDIIVINDRKYLPKWFLFRITLVRPNQNIQ